MKLKLLALVSVLVLPVAVLAQTPAKAGPSPEALERRTRSNERLAAESVVVPADLPVIPDSAAAKIRTKEQVVQRAIAVCLTAIKAERMDMEKIADLVKYYKAKKFLTPEETEFIENAASSNEEQNRYLWRYEGLAVLMWALGYTDSLGRPDTAVEVKQIVGPLSQRTLEQFTADAKLRSPAEILDETDLIFRYQWAVNDARKHGKSAPAGLDRGIVQQRLDMLNWLVGR
jgi:hypothetical protein